MENCTSNMSLLPQPQKQMSLHSKKIWIKSCSNGKHEKQEFVQFERSSMHNALVLLKFIILDELIRQITIQCLERGFLLVRVRDELRMTIESYQALYESAIAYGMRKALLAEQKRNDMNNETQKLDRECTELQNSVKALEKNVEDMENAFREESEKTEKKHKELVEIEKNKNQLLKEDLQRLLSAQPQAAQDKTKAKK